MKLFKPNPSGDRKPASPAGDRLRRLRENRPYIVWTFVNTVLFYGTYVVLLGLIPESSTVILTVYLVLLAAFSFGYVFYNRGFTRKNLTVEMLPPTWSEDEKREYVEDGQRRMKRSKWCITVIFPLVFTFFMDLFYLFIYLEYFAPIFGELF